MKNSDFASIIVYLLMFIIALFIGLNLIQPANEALGNIRLTDQYIFAVSVILIGLVINVILFELGHVFGALLGGYSILSVNILGLCFYRSNKGSFKFGFKRFEGLTGETRILAKRPNANPRLFLFGPTIFTIIHFIVAVVLYLSLPVGNIVHHSVLVIAGIGALLLVYNIMPFKLDTITDGYQIIMLSKKINVEAYNEIIRIESASYLNSINKDKEVISVGEIKVFDVITTMTSRVNLYKIYEYIDKKQLDKALPLIEQLIENKTLIEEEIGGRAISQKLFIILMTKPKEAAKLYFMDELTAKERKFISNDVSMESLRSYLLYSGIVEKSESECKFIINRVKKALKLRMDNSRRLIEIDLFKEAFDKVVKENPEWELTLPTF